MLPRTFLSGILGLALITLAAFRLNLQPREMF
jgi:hypothetical protein